MLDCWVLSRDSGVYPVCVRASSGASVCSLLAFSERCDAAVATVGPFSDASKPKPSGYRYRVVRRRCSMPGDCGHHSDLELSDFDNYIFLSCCHALLLYILARRQYNTYSRSVSLPARLSVCSKHPSRITRSLVSCLRKLAGWLVGEIWLKSAGLTFFRFQVQLVGVAQKLNKCKLLILLASLTQQCILAYFPTGKGLLKIQL